METLFSAYLQESALLLGLFRHGPAGKPDAVEYPNDDLRPLTPKGCKIVKHCSQGLAKLGFVPTLILSSPAERCRESAEIARKVFGLPAKSLRTQRFLHSEFPPCQALRRMERLKLKGIALLVGHEPWLGECLALLLTGRRSRSLPRWAGKPPRSPCRCFLSQR